MVLAGIPATMDCRSTFLVTTEFAPIIAPSPMVTPDNITTLSPIHTLFPIVTPPFVLRGLFLGGKLKSVLSPWLWSVIKTYLPVRTLFPIVMLEIDVIWLYSPIWQLLPIIIVGLYLSFPPFLYDAHAVICEYLPIIEFLPIDMTMPEFTSHFFVYTYWFTLHVIKTLPALLYIKVRSGLKGDV